MAPCELLFKGGVYDVVGAYPRCPCAGFYWVKEYTRGCIPCAHWQGLSNPWVRVPFFTICVVLT